MAEQKTPKPQPRPYSGEKPKGRNILPEPGKAQGQVRTKGVTPKAGSPQPGSQGTASPT